MANGMDDRLNVRITEDVGKRIDALVPKVAALPEARLLGVVGRSDVVRLALLRGLVVLEREIARKRDKPA